MSYSSFSSLNVQVRDKVTGDGGKFSIGDKFEKKLKEIKRTKKNRSKRKKSLK